MTNKSASSSKLVAGWALPSPAGNWYKYGSVITSAKSIVPEGDDVQITLQTYTYDGRIITTGGSNVVFTPTDGSLTSVVDNNDGTYTSTLTQPSNIVIIQVTQDGVLLDTSVEIEAEE